MEKNFKAAAEAQKQESEAPVAVPDQNGGENDGSGLSGSGSTARPCAMEGLMSAGVDLGDVVSRLCASVCNVQF